MCVCVCVRLCVVVGVQDNVPPPFPSVHSCTANQLTYCRNKIAVSLGTSIQYPLGINLFSLNTKNFL